MHFLYEKNNLQCWTNMLLHRYKDDHIWIGVGATRIQVQDNAKEESLGKKGASTNTRANRRTLCRKESIPIWEQYRRTLGHLLRKLQLYQEKSLLQELLGIHQLLLGQSSSWRPIDCSKMKQVCWQILLQGLPFHLERRRWTRSV